MQNPVTPIDVAPSARSASAAAAKSRFRFSCVIEPMTAAKSAGSTSWERAKKSGAITRYPWSARRSEKRSSWADMPLPSCTTMIPGPRRSASAAGATVKAGSVSERLVMSRLSRASGPRACVGRAGRCGYPRNPTVGQDEQPRNLKAMLSEAKDTSELMVDLAYAALFFGDSAMADEVHELEEILSDLAHAMREVCVLAARSPRDAEEMSSVLHVLSAIERMGNAAVDIARIVTHSLGIPAALVADLAAAEEVSHRVRVRPDALLAHRSLATACLPTEVGMRVVAIRRGKEWVIDPDGDEVLLPEDVLILRGAPAGIPELRVLAGAPEWRPPGTDDDPAIPTDLDRAVDVLVEMKNVSEVAIGLAYSALLFNDQGLAAEVNHLEDRLDEMRERLEVWVLRGAAEQVEPSPLRGLLHLGAAAEELGDAAQQMVWLVEENEEMHPVLALAFGDTDEVIVRVPVSPGSYLDGRAISAINLELETGYYLLAIRRAGRYLYRPRGSVEMLAGDELIASGPEEGRSRFAELGGYRVLEDDATGEIALVRVES